MSKNLKKILVTGASLLMMASVGASYNNSGASAKSRTRVVRISHLKKWQRNRINHAKYIRNKNNHKIKLFKSYLKHHKYGKRVLQYRWNVSDLTKQNKKLNHQIYQYSYKKIVTKPKRTYKKHNIKHRYNKKRAKKSVRKHNVKRHYTKNTKRVKRVAKVTPAQQKINAALQHGRVMHDQIGQQINAERQADNEIINNDLGGSQQNSIQQPSQNGIQQPSQNADAIYKKAYNDVEPQYQQANNNIQHDNQVFYGLTTGTQE